MSTAPRVLVYGASGHTGRFVVEELLGRGLTPVPAGRPGPGLDGLAARHPGLEPRASLLDDAAGLRRALSGIDVVVNCAGPFLDTAVPLARAAVDAGAHYVDVTAEQPVVARLYQELDEPARAAGVAVVPALAFYGGLADLLVTVALDGGLRADSVEVAIGLDRWWPTPGTRATGARNRSVRQVIRGGALDPLPDPAPAGRWSFRPPIGDQAVTQVPFSEVIAIHRHLEVGELRSFLTSASLADLREPSTPPPPEGTADRRSPQQFVVDVVARIGATTRRVEAAGRDIYAVTAPIVAEGVVRLLDGHPHGGGALAPAQAFDPCDMLAALERHPGGLVLHR